MFTHLIDENNKLIKVSFSKYAKRHFLRNFEKKYRGAQWTITLDSIIVDISRMRVHGNNMQLTQQVDELWHRDNFWVFKYDFAVAKTNKSKKGSGNRCVVFLDAIENSAEILLIYSKDDLPKNMGEQAFIEKVLKNWLLEKD